MRDVYPGWVDLPSSTLNLGKKINQAKNPIIVLRQNQPHTVPRHAPIGYCSHLFKGMSHPHPGNSPPLLVLPGNVSRQKPEGICFHISATLLTCPYRGPYTTSCCLHPHMHLIRINTPNKWCVDKGKLASHRSMFFSRVYIYV